MIDDRPKDDRAAKRSHTRRLAAATALLALVLTAVAIERAWSWQNRPWLGMAWGSTMHPAPVYGISTRLRPGVIGRVVDFSPAARAGVEGRVVAVEGVPIGEVAALRSAVSTMRSGRPLTLSVTTPGSRLPRPVEVTPENALANPVASLGLLVATVVALAFLAIAFVVWSRRPGDRRARLFYALCAVAACSFVTDAVARVEVATPWGEMTLARALLDSGGDALEVATLALFFHFVLVFPHRRPILEARPRTTLGALYGAAVLVPALWGVQHFPLGETPSVVVGVLGMPLVVGFWFTAFFGIPIALSRSYREAGAEEKRQLRWPFWAFVVAFGIPWAAGLLSAASAAHMPGETASRLFSDLTVVAFDLLLLLIPVAFAVAISKYRLMEIDRILRKTTVYAILTLVLGGIFLVLAGGVGAWLVGVIGFEQDWVLVASALVVAAALVPVRRQVQEIVERRLFPRRFTYPEAREHLRKLARSHQGDEVALAREIATTVQAAMDVESVVLLAAEEEILRPVASVGLSERQVGGLRLPVTSAPARGGSIWVGVGGIAADAARALQAARISGLQPVRLGEETIGGLGVGRRLDGEPFGEEDLELLEVAAESFADGHNRLTARVRGEEAEEARRIQENLLPRELPSLPGVELAAAWKPAREVGGDSYDAILLDDGTIGLSISDVVGKGVPAALLMSNLQATLRAFASLELSPVEMCRRLHRLVRSNVALGRFVTLFYAIFDAPSRRLRHCNAGQVPPLLRRADGRMCELATGGPALGAFAWAEYDEGEIELEAGDRVVLVTDGVTEALDAEGRMFGDEGLRRVIAAASDASAEELVERIVAAVEAHAGGSRTDDTTIVVLAVDPSR